MVLLYNNQSCLSMALQQSLCNHKDPSHNPNQGLTALQIHIWAWVDHIASQPLLQFLLTAAGSHLCWPAPLEALEGEKQWETPIFICSHPKLKLQSPNIFWPHTTGSEKFCLMTQQKSDGTAVELFMAVHKMERKQIINMFGITSCCSGYKRWTWKLSNGSCMLC